MSNAQRRSPRPQPPKPVEPAVTPVDTAPIVPLPEAPPAPALADPEIPAPTPADAMTDGDQPDPDAVPEKIKPQRYAPGDIADRRLYGLISHDGTVTATADEGTTEPAPGERGTIIAMPGQQIGHATHRLLYPPKG